MSLSINKYNKKTTTKLSSTTSSLSLLTNATITATTDAYVTTPLTRKRALIQQQQQELQKQNSKIAKIPPLRKSPSSTTPLTPVLQASSNVSAADTLFSNLMEQRPFELTQSAKVTAKPVLETEAAIGVKAKVSVVREVGHKVYRTTMPSFKIMSYQNIFALLTLLVCGLVTVNGLKCYMCGQYNEGVGSITPCLNYSEQYAHLYLKECSKKSEKYCVKYVSELSIVRDCATECAEKEIWETQTYCCTEDGCNGSSTIEASAIAIIFPVVFYIFNEILNILRQQRR